MAWGLAVLLSVYLALSGGGYDIVVRSEIGLIVWWVVVLGVLIGVLPRARIPRAGWIATALLGGFLLWTWLGLSWTSSHELTLDQVGQLSTYLGIFVLGLCALSAETARPLVNGLGCGIVIVSGLAILSKLTPGLFPANTARSFYATPRLSLSVRLLGRCRRICGARDPSGALHGDERADPGRTRDRHRRPEVVLLCLAMTVSTRRHPRGLRRRRGLPGARPRPAPAAADARDRRRGIRPH